MPVNVGDLVRAQIQFAHDGSNKAMNVFHYEVTQVNDSNIPNFFNAMRVEILGHYQAAIGLLIDGNVDGTSIKWAIKKGSPDRWVERHESDFIFTGLALNDVLPLGAAYHVKFPLVDGGRSGSKFLFGVNETHHENGIFAPASFIMVNIWGAAMALPITSLAGAMKPVVVTKTWQVKDFAGTAVVTNLPAYQRRRKQGVGW